MIILFSRYKSIYIFDRNIGFVYFDLDNLIKNIILTKSDYFEKSLSDNCNIYSIYISNWILSGLLFSVKEFDFVSIISTICNKII